ncbi:MAG: aminopeptidase P family protein [Alphaproteobacteria bacterium]
MEIATSAHHHVYQGDMSLLQLLRKANARIKTILELETLVDGVLAGGELGASEDWTALVADTPSSALTDQLHGFLAQRASLPKPLPLPIAKRLDNLRKTLGEEGLSGFLIPHADEYQNEYLPPCNERLTWLTGFTGSAGFAVVLKNKAAVFTDGRYTLQVQQEVDSNLFEICHLIETPPAIWLAHHLSKDDLIGYDPWLHSLSEIETLRTVCQETGAVLRPVKKNPVDQVWRERPPAPLGPVVPHDNRFAGRDSAAKRHELGQTLAKVNLDTAVITAPDSIAWLLNIRGNDVAHTPLPLSYALLHANGQVDLFVDKRKLTSAARRHLGNEVRILSSDEFIPALNHCGEIKSRILVDTRTAPVAVYEYLKIAGSRIIKGTDPCVLPKAIKNSIEIAGTRAAHLRDGAALTKFLAWLARTAPTGQLTEMSAAAQLLTFRRETGALRDTSFTTISGAGPNGAIVHYRVSPATDRALKAGDVYLVDSGGQYQDGTTDVTRTVLIGAPNLASSEIRDRFTRVLKGHITLAMARFPKGTSGGQLDSLARAALWEAGLDYDHGTGHGVGSYLSVHEGPHRIAKNTPAVPLEPGMIVSNEPGYYKSGAYGIRIENLVTVISLDVKGAERPLLGFETLTLAPIDRALIEPSLLSGAEAEWLNSYHSRVQRELAPLLDPATTEWLKQATQPILPT